MMLTNAKVCTATTVFVLLGSIATAFYIYSLLRDYQPTSQVQQQLRAVSEIVRESGGRVITEKSPSYPIPTLVWIPHSATPDIRKQLSEMDGLTTSLQIISSGEMTLAAVEVTTTDEQASVLHSEYGLDPHRHCGINIRRAHPMSYFHRPLGPCC